MTTKLRTFLALPREERRSLTRAWIYLLVADVALRLLPVLRVERLLTRLAKPRRFLAAVPARRLAGLTSIAASHHLRPMACLPRSLALQALLRRSGMVAELRIGVRQEDGSLMAHAWVEHAGAPLGEPVDVNRLYFPLRGAR